MAYVGGKAKGSNFIIDILNNPKYDNLSYLEPFVGYAHIMKKVRRKKRIYLGDNNENLIVLLKYIQKCDGKYPVISPAKYQKLRETKATSIEKSMAAFAYSYNGKEFAGYVNKKKEGDKIRIYPEERKKHYETLRALDTFRGATIKQCEYKSWEPLISKGGFVVYCDPPYINTQGYTTSSDFDHEKFWETMRRWSRLGNHVFVSEYIAPRDFATVGSSQKRLSLAGKGAAEIRTEKLFKWRGR